MSMHEYFIPDGLEPAVKVGDKVYAGDQLSNGIASPKDIVKHKGIGEGRAYYVRTMKKAFAAGGLSVNRRNFEVIAKGAIDHVRITDPDGLGGHLPNTITSYQALEKSYKARPDTQEVRIDHALGKYLEQPILHYTIGTRITPQVVEQLKKNHIEFVHVHDKPPGFEPEMIRLVDVPAHDEDWMAQLNSTNLERRLLQAVNSGASSNLKGPSPIAGIAYGVGFADKKAEEIKD